MTPTVTTGEFEGPLALLLDLVEQRQLEVTEISIAAITADYLAHVQRLDRAEPEALSEFLQLGARLVYIKSLALLPRESADEQTGELRQLQVELAEYRRYQQAARELGQLAGRASWARPVVTQLAPRERPLPDLSLEQLAGAFSQALRQHEPARPSAIIKTPLSQAAVIKRLRTRLVQGSLPLQQILDQVHDRLEIVVTFLAVLELMKQGQLRVTQDGQFAPVTLELTHD
jgi:segregation and condensation protein A